MLGNAWSFITLVLLLVAAILRQPPLLLVAVLLFLASGTARLWAAYALRRLECERRLSTTRAFFGDTIDVEISVSNRKLLPLPWVHIQDEVPEEVTFLKGTILGSHIPTRALLSNLVSLGWYRRLIRRFPMKCQHRGVFTFGPTTVHAGDLFGFFRKEMTVDRRDTLLVYPKVVPLEYPGIPSRDPIGDIAVRQHLFQDPIRTISIREYTPGDPLRHIHWKATARLRRLQSKVFERTTTVDLALFLDTRTTPPPSWGIADQLLETAIIAAASIADHALANEYRTGLYVNEPYRHSASIVKLAPTDHPQQMQRVLEALAQVQGMPLMPVEDMVSTEVRGLSWPATIAVITAMPTAALVTSLQRLRRAGRRVALVLVGSQAAQHPVPDGMPVYHVPDDVPWQELDSLVIHPGAREGRSRAYTAARHSAPDRQGVAQ